LTAAVKLARPEGRRGPFEMDMAKLRKAGNAYPGTMVVYTAARLQNLAPEDATKVAQFIRIATTEGQRAGSGNGELPGGFVPIRDSGATRALYARAQSVARAIEKQKVPAAAPAAAGPATVSPGSATAAPAGDPVAAGAPAAPPAGAPEALTMPPTQAVSSELSGRLLPALLLLGLVFTVVSAGSRIVRLRSRR
jgi:hypothetical protein